MFSILLKPITITENKHYNLYKCHIMIWLSLRACVRSNIKSVRDTSQKYKIGRELEIIDQSFPTRKPKRNNLNIFMRNPNWSMATPRYPNLRWLYIRALMSLMAWLWQALKYKEQMNISFVKYASKTSKLNNGVFKS